MTDIDLNHREINKKAQDYFCYWADEFAKLETTEERDQMMKKMLEITLASMVNAQHLMQSTGINIDMGAKVMDVDTGKMNHKARIKLVWECVDCPDEVDQYTEINEATGVFKELLEQSGDRNGR